VGYIFSGLAAGLAMTFAVIIAIFAERLFIRNTGAWGFIIIVSYILKDRLKDGLKEIFGRLMPRFLSDRIQKLLEPARPREAGRMYTNIKFGLEKNQPAEVIRIRNYQANPFSSFLPPQDILSCHSALTIRSRELLKRYNRISALAQITRIRMDDWLANMDDPEEVQYRLEKGERTLISGARVYHVHMIVSLREEGKGGKPRLFHYVLVMNQTGILRIEAAGDNL
jgi:hypothetical protein